MNKLHTCIKEAIKIINYLVITFPKEKSSLSIRHCSLDIVINVDSCGKFYVSVCAYKNFPNISCCILRSSKRQKSNFGCGPSSLPIKFDWKSTTV